MRRHRNNLRRNPRHGNEQGMVIMLVAVFMLFVVGAMAALSIDAVTLYSARSEAQLAADGAALAGARVLANSGATSDTTGALLATMEAVTGPAKAVALQVAEQNQVAGSYLAAAQVIVTFGGTGVTNPTVTVRIQKNDLPTFFARIWGTTQFTVAALATAEAYNPSNTSGAATNSNPPVAPTCVKPWLLPNIDPTQTIATGPAIFYPSGAIVNAGLVGKGWPNTIGGAFPNLAGLRARATTGTPMPGRYYAGAIDAADFSEPTQSLPACSTGFTPYQHAVAGCVPRPIPCGATATINKDTSATTAMARNIETLPAVECLIHYNGAAGDSDKIDTAALPSLSFPFLAGSENPVANAIGNDVPVSDSLVTIPVYDSGAAVPPATVTVIGFLQVFLNPDSVSLPSPAPPTNNQIPVTIINMAGCGNTTATPPILGNGASPVAVRLISP
jgi:hypothetical protein